MGLVHELAITESVVDAVLEKTGEQVVVGVRLEIGRLSGVVPDSVRFCFELVAAGTPVENARLEIEEPPGLARCRTCEADLVMTDSILLCPCGSADLEVYGGQQLRILSVEVA